MNGRLPRGSFGARAREPWICGPYRIYEAFASGGMATVHVGERVSLERLSHAVAVKRLHPHVAVEPCIAAMLVSEARLMAHIRHPNVVAILDVIEDEGDVMVVMELVDGESLAQVLRLSPPTEPFPLPIAAGIATQMLQGLHAAHEARDEANAPLGIVHRDVSPQNILLGRDGVVRVIDFGVAKAASLTVTTEDGRLKGKIPYMAPEQLLARAVDRRTDVYAAGIVLWEMVTKRRFHEPGADYRKIVSWVEGTERPAPPSSLREGVPYALDEVIQRALEREPLGRYATATEMADAIARATSVAEPRELARWFASRLAGPIVAGRVRAAADGGDRTLSATNERGRPPRRWRRRGRRLRDGGL